MGWEVGNVCDFIVVGNQNISSYDLFINIGTFLGVLTALCCMKIRLKKITLVAVAIASLAVAMYIGKFLSTFVRQITNMSFGSVDVLMEKLAANAGNHFSGRVLAVVLFYVLFYTVICLILRKKQEISTVWNALDGVAFFIVIQHFFNRLACFMNGCCYGIPYNGVFSITLPNLELRYPLFPVQLLEMVFMLTLFCIVYCRWKKKKHIFALTIFGFGLTIIISEFFTDQRGALLFLGVNFIQIIGLLLCICGFIYRSKEHKNEN